VIRSVHACYRWKDPGRCIYEAEFAPCEGGWHITEAWFDSRQNDLFALHSTFLEVLITGVILKTADDGLKAAFAKLGGSRAIYS
jgi:hypothetical protein